MRRLVELLTEYAAENKGHMSCVALTHAPEQPDIEEDLKRFADFHPVRGKAKYIASAASITRKLNPDFALVGHIGLSPAALMLKKCGLLRSYGVVLHGREVWGRSGWLDRIAARNANYLISTTNHTARIFCARNGIRWENARVIPLGLGERNARRPEGSSSNGTLQILTVGRLVSADNYKGVDTLIQATAKMLASGVPAHLNIVGGGNDVPRLKNICRESGLNGSVSFWGWVSDKQLEHFYRSCDVFAMPSAKEGFGIVFLEAMQYGKPCIGGDHGGTPEVIDHGVDGFLVQHGDVSRLSTLLTEFALKPGLRRRMGENARNKVIRFYLYPQLRQRWFAFLDEAVGNGRMVR